MNLPSRLVSTVSTGQTATLTPFGPPTPAVPHDGMPDPFAAKTFVLVGTPKDPIGLTTQVKGPASQLNVNGELNQQSAWNTEVPQLQGDASEVNIYGRDGYNPNDYGDRDNGDRSSEDDNGRMPGVDTGIGGYDYSDKNGFGRKGIGGDNGDSDSGGDNSDYGFGGRGIPGLPDDLGGFNPTGNGGGVPDVNGSHKRGSGGDDYGDGTDRSGGLGTGPNSLGGVIGPHLKGYGTDRGDEDRNSGAKTGATIGGLIGGVAGAVVGGLIGTAYDAAKSVGNAADKAGKQEKANVDRNTGDGEGTIDDIGPKSDDNKPNPNNGNRPSDEGGGTGGPRANAYMPADDGSGGTGPRLSTFNQYLPADDSGGGGTPRSRDFRPSDEGAAGGGPRSNALNVANELAVG
jgi:hypothetical protein